MQKRPSLIVGGAPKSGTSALYRYLEQHPQVCLARKKELHFFSRPCLEKCVSGPGDSYVLAEIPATFEAYQAYFEHCGESRVIVDISPSYLYHRDSAIRIKEHLGHVKMLFILRNPADKAFSQYMHLLGVGRETLDFPDALEAESVRARRRFGDMWLYKQSGYYAGAVEHFISVLGEQNVKVIYYDEFIRDQSASLKEICSFAGLNADFRFTPVAGVNRSGKPRSSIVSKLIAPNRFTYAVRRIFPQRFGRYLRNSIKNANTGSKPELHEELKHSLMDAYIDDILKLEAIVGRRSGWLVDDDDR